MVTIQNVNQRITADGKVFHTLEIHSEPVMVQSQNTGKFYMTTFKCSIPCTFGVDVAERMIGKELPGTIVRTTCDPYEYTVPDTGEVIILGFRYEYSPVETNSPVQPVQQIQQA